MFTGIVEETGTVRGLVEVGDAAVLDIAADVVLAGTRPGDSVAVAGVCLTVTDLTEGGFRADVMGETLHRSALGGRRPGDPVNLERAVTPLTRLGGHLVQGHVDTTAALLARTPAEHWEVLRFGLPAALARYVVEKGSICVDGVSLTVSALGADFFEVSLIPTTLAGTTLGSLVVGALVNLEVDLVAKYVERLLAAGAR